MEEQKTPRTRYPEQYRRQAVAMWQAGQTITQIQTALGVYGGATIQYWLRGAGVYRPTRVVRRRAKAA